MNGSTYQGPPEYHGYIVEFGQRLRDIRLARRLTLQDVEEKSGGRWKAVVIGSYERGDRAMSVAVLAILAEFYGLPIVELLPRTPEALGSASPASLGEARQLATRLIEVLGGESS